MKEMISLIAGFEFEFRMSVVLKGILRTEELKRIE